MHRARSTGSLAVAGALALTLLGAPACSLVGGASSSSKVTLTSRDGQIALIPDVRTSVYHAIDENEADVYVSDLAPDDLLAGLRGEAGVSGIVLHVHMFIMPRAGQTPIDYTASNTSITVIVLADGHAGVYGGGGFLLPGRAPGGKRFGGSMRGTTLRLMRHDEGFVDRLGTCELSGRLGAVRDDELADRIGALMLRFAQRQP